MVKYTISDLKEVAKQNMNPPPCDDKMQVVVKEAHEGVATGTWTIDPSFLNGHKVVMGGFISGAADIMMAYAISSLLRDEEGFASIDLDTTFHRPAFEGVVEVTATVERKGRSIAYVTADVRQNDKLVANCVSSMVIVPA